MVLFGIVEMIKGNLMSLGLVYFHILSLMLIHGQIRALLVMYTLKILYTHWIKLLLLFGGHETIIDTDF